MLVRIDEHTEYSPYFKRHSSFEVKISVEVDLDEDLLSNYLDFLYGREFTMSGDDASFFDFMGHPNESLYPLDYWKLKLRSIWIRDNFYKLKLYENPLYGLTEVKKMFEILPFGNTLMSNDTGMVIAGGAALYMTGMSPECDDVDLFSMDKEKSTTYFRNACAEVSKNPDRNYHREVWASTGLNSYDITMSISERKYRACQDDYHTYNHIQKKVSLIRRVYTCPAEVVHGFDVDCCQFVLVDGVLYGTEIALYSIRKKCNWIDMRWNSPTYIRRLAKYHSRGIRLRLPLLTHESISCPHLQWMVHCDRDRPGYIETFLPYLKEKEIARDPASILIYISFYDITYTILLRALTGQKEDEPYRYDSVVVDKFVWDAHWIEVDPMQQISSNLFPEYSDTIINLYLQSPLIDSNIKSIISSMR